MTEKITLPCKHVSHTAWLVAAFRAQESNRLDAHFHDHLAIKLLGSLEEKYLGRFSKLIRSDFWLLSVRTYYIDRLIMDSIKQGIKSIINLGAGLDTRPYRLPLPENIRWYEADYDEVMTYKNETLKSEKPRCKLERISADLSLAHEREAVLKKVNDAQGPTMVLTEGLLPYLSEEDVRKLAQDLFAVPSAKYWLMDIYNKSILNFLHSSWEESSTKEEDDLSFQTLPKDTQSFLKPFGWHVREFLSFGQGALELNRLPRGTSPEEVKAEPSFFESGVCLFQK